ncbi:MAG: membrane protein insertion efficiency factor YidD [Cyanobacteria bacterium]|nr:membrane protein insertion efficiency factor YidD [Cyanobacteriota bacterium]MDA1020681.1 membrane protein insertion efficiency factor YidD [Cyanobacteriota bacterium]
MKLLIVTLIKCYQATVAFRQPSCRFSPSCSHYAIEAIDQYGIWRGVRLTISRLLRCHPFGAHGYDPVPPKRGDQA